MLSIFSSYSIVSLIVLNIILHEEDDSYSMVISSGLIENCSRSVVYVPSG